MAKKRTAAYLALAERVRAINPEAAEFLMGEEIERMPDLCRGRVFGSVLPVGRFSARL